MNLVLLVLFLVLMIAVGGDRGVISLMALLGNVIVFFISIYIMKYNNPYILVMADIVFMCLLTLLYQNGINVKTVSALISVILVSAVLIILSRYIGNMGHVGGYNEFELYEDTLMNLSVKIGIHLPDVAVAMLVLGVTGALIDLAVAVTSSLYEVWKEKQDMSDSELYQTGIKLGGSILGSNINTLWFACIGEFLLMFLLFRKYEYTFSTLINSKAFFQNFSSVLLSGAGCAMVVPVSSFVFVKVLKRWKNS